ncbi:hypothetical protein BH09VER1_BH09VER1_44000 [soil metagenome]
MFHHIIFARFLLVAMDQRREICSTLRRVMIRWKSLKNAVKAYVMSSFEFADDTLVLTYLCLKEHRIPLADIQKIVVVNTGSDQAEGEPVQPREIHFIGAIVTEREAIPIRLREDGEFLRQAGQHSILIQAVTRKRQADPDLKDGAA